MNTRSPAPDDPLYEHAPCGLLSTNEHGLIQRVNRTFCAMLGYDRPDLLEQKRIQDLLTMGSKIFHQTHWMPLLQMQGSVGEIQLELVHRYGDTVPALINSVRVLDGPGLRHDLAVFLATDRRKYERELLEARKRAEALLESERAAQNALAEALRAQERSSRERAQLAEELVGIVSHDLRTPLNVVTLGLDVLSKVDDAQLRQRTIAQMGSATQRSTRMISDLLDLTQARIGGGLRIRRSEVDVAKQVRDAVDELRLSAPSRALAYAHEGAPHAQVDADRLSQLVTNLAGNALTYGSAEREVRVSTHVDDGVLQLDVHNWGPPIPEALAPHLFEPMRRGPQQVQLGSRSVGLGLYIVQQIARAHGGRVDLESNEAEGTLFRVVLPPG